ncbi:MAG: aspartate/glutamate racemase family protein [Acidimicrobiales bacterium]
MAFRLCVVNPNSDESVTAHLAGRAVAVLAPGAEVVPLTCAGAPPVIETAEESVAAAAWVATAGRVAADAYVVGCFGNPGVAALRQGTGAPVVGLGEAALLDAKASAMRFGVLTTLAIGADAVGVQVEEAAGPGRCVGVRAVNEPSYTGPLPERLAQGGQSLLAAGAAGVVLACATFAPESAALSAALGVPVWDGASLAPALAHTLWLGHAAPAATLVGRARGAVRA